MIVYSDAVQRVTPRDAVQRLEGRVRRALRAERPSLDQLRTLLIMAGQLEQAVLDAPHATVPPCTPAQLRCLSQFTECCAEAFVTEWSAQNDPRLRAESAPAWLGRAARALQSLERPSGQALRLKNPEGFAHYALYPEQYVEAALLFCGDRADAAERDTVVVGIRSIGTTLAALVAAVLRRRGFPARRLTLRPTGHPFARRASLEPGAVTGARWALVVDEGPGLSGSSMVAVAEALMRAGLPRAALCFLPGHDGPPGAAASPAIRAFWASTPRYVVPIARIRLCGATLPDTLAGVLPQRYGPAARVVSIEDLSAGRWRELVYPSRESWPAVCTRFERTKLLCTTSGGARYLFKFAGLGCRFDDDRTPCQHEAGALQRRARLGLTPRPIARAHGFVVTRWIEGHPLQGEQASPALLSVMGRYLALSSEARLTHDEQEQALERLEGLLSANAAEALGEAAARRVREAFLSGVRDDIVRAPRAYGDGRLAPHEWLRTPAGELLKVDCTGHATDHTAVGRQSVLWDLAGAAIEWKLSPAQLNTVLRGYEHAGGEEVRPAALASYRLAYAAFRAGQFKLCADSACDDFERDALARAFGGYCAELCRVL